MSAPELHLRRTSDGRIALDAKSFPRFATLARQVVVGADPEVIRKSQRTLTIELNLVNGRARYKILNDVNVDGFYKLEVDMAEMFAGARS